MLVNGGGFPVFYAESGAQRIGSRDLEMARMTQITGYDLEADVKWVQGVQYRYPNATQVRTIAYDKSRKIVQITDHVETAEKLEAQFLYHIAAGVTVEAHDTGWTLSRNGVPAANVYVSSEAPLKLETITDSAGKAPYYTALYGRSNTPETGSLLLVSAACSKWDNEVRLTVELSPQSEFADTVPECVIDRESPSAVIKEMPVRPYGPYYISIELTGKTASMENMYIREKAAYTWEIFDSAKNRIAHGKYSKDREWSYTFEAPGTYYIKAWIRMPDGEKLRTFSRMIEVLN